jgi:23S rRNA (cytosine1962-C5)-methyltransferase
VETFALGPHQRIAEFLPILHEAAGTHRAVVRMDARAAEREGCPALPEILPEGLRAVRIEEHGVRFAVSFIEGQKTGFFCDQRDNRKRFAEFSKDRSVLDVCCYTGGFSVVAVKRGGAREATGVDLDEKAIDQARHNANLNQVRVNWTHADAFTYLRQMVRNGRKWDAIVVDPPKFIPTREDVEEGQKKYYDLNRLALQVASPGGLFVTCSCSGLLAPEEFEKLVFRAARAVDRRLQVLDVTGAGPDHPVASNCPESRYLKVLWTRVL